VSIKIAHPYIRLAESHVATFQTRSWPVSALALIYAMAL
jgi:hypothetical protein